MCIFCSSRENSATVEHVFPEAIGGALTISSVCKACNDRLGSEVDVLLTEEPLVRMLRLGLRIPGKDGMIRSPLHDGTIMGHPNVRGSFKQPSRSGAGVVAIRPSVIRSTAPDGRDRAEICASREEFSEILGKIEQRAHRRGEKVRIIEEWEAVVKGPVVSSEMSADLTGLVRPLLKIAYELATEWLGATYVEDPTAVALRGAVSIGHVADIDAAIGYLPLGSPFAKWGLRSVSHAAAMWEQGGSGYVAIRIFNVIEAQVRVTDVMADYGAQRPRWTVLDPLKADVQSGLGSPTGAAESTTLISWVEVSSGVFEVRTFYEGLETTKTTLALHYGG